MMEAALVAIFAFLAAIIFAGRAKRNTHLLQHYERCMSSFIEDSATLMDADETPAVIVEIVDFIAAKAADRRGSREFLHVVLRYRSAVAPYSKSETAQTIAEFKSRNPQLGRVFSRAMASGLLAMTYNGGAVGTFLRRIVLFDAKQHEDRSQDLATSFREVECAQPA